MALSAMSINILCVDLANALDLTYVYRGNNFDELQVELGIFSPDDNVTAQFTIDCATAHSEGDCKNLPYNDYVDLGAIELEPLSFSAGPASLPTSDGRVEVARFFFSTDSNARIVEWDMDLFLPDPSGVINVDTDNIDGGIDSASVSGAGAVVRDNPGEWRILSVPVAIDIKPGNRKNVINPHAKGGIWVAVLSDTDSDSPFDPSSQVDIPAVEFGPDGANAIRHKVKDINKDGLGDLLLRFKIPATGIACGDTDATLTGEAFDGQGFSGTDFVKTVSCTKSKKPKNKDHKGK